MSTQKSFFARLFSRKPKQAVLPIAFGHMGPPLDHVRIQPNKLAETPRKRVPYIPTNESPWSVIVWRGKRWQFYGFRTTRDQARNLAGSLSRSGEPARVVRAIIPTR